MLSSCQAVLPRFTADSAISISAASGTHSPPSATSSSVARGCTAGVVGVQEVTVPSSQHRTWLVTH